MAANISEILNTIAGIAFWSTVVLGIASLIAVKILDRWDKE